jgi:hypothetical protein
LLKPGAKETACGAEESKVVGAVGEVASVDLGGAEVFEVVEAGEFGGCLAWSEEELEGFAGLLNARGKGIVGELFEPGEHGPGLPVIKDKPAVGRPCGDETQGRTEGFESEIRDDTEPCKEGWSRRIETSGEKLGGKRLVLEVYGDEGEVLRDRDATGFEQFVFPLLRGGVIDLKDAEIRVGVAVGEAVEACSKENVLRDAFVDGLGESVFGVATAGDEESAECGGEGLLQFGGGLIELGQKLLAEDGDGDGVVKDERLGIIELVRGAAQSYSEGGSRGNALLHCVCEYDLSVSWM